jgi:hypothetical protein
MNIQEFTKLVREMRRAQLDYYRDRTYGKLMAAKNLERQVDTALRVGVVMPSTEITHEPTQLALAQVQPRTDEKLPLTELTDESKE